VTEHRYEIRRGDGGLGEPRLWCALGGCRGEGQPVAEPTGHPFTATWTFERMAEHAVRYGSPAEALAATSLAGRTQGRHQYAVLSGVPTDGRARVAIYCQTPECSGFDRVVFEHDGSSNGPRLSDIARGINGHMVEHGVFETITGEASAQRLGALCDELRTRLWFPGRPETGMTEYVQGLIEAHHARQRVTGIAVLPVPARPSRGRLGAWWLIPLGGACAVAGSALARLFGW
jgi:hypothetical protein